MGGFASLAVKTQGGLKGAISLTLAVVDTLKHRVGFPLHRSPFCSIDHREGLGIEWMAGLCVRRPVPVATELLHYKCYLFWVVLR